LSCWTTSLVLSVCRCRVRRRRRRGTLPLPQESFPGGRLRCDDRQGGAVKLGVRLPRLSLADRTLLIVCGPGAGQQPGTYAGEQDQGRHDTIVGGALVGDAACR
jgi:hypothetical protein